MVRPPAACRTTRAAHAHVANTRAKKDFIATPVYRDGVSHGVTSSEHAISNFSNNRSKRPHDMKKARGTPVCCLVQSRRLRDRPDDATQQLTSSLEGVHESDFEVLIGGSPGCEGRPR